METGTLLIVTADNRVIPVTLEYYNAAEKARKTMEYRNYFEDKTYHEIVDLQNRYISNPGAFSDTEGNILNSINSSNADFLAQELPVYSFDKKPTNYRNDLHDNIFPPEIAHKPYTIHFNNQITDDNIPQMFKSLGFVIEAQDKVYDVVYDAAAHEYVVPNFSNTRATVYSSANCIKWWRNHFTFPPVAYARLKGLIADFEHAHSRNSSLNINDYIYTIDNAQDRSLFAIYAKEYDQVQHGNLSLLHELQHVKNEIMKAGLALKKNSKHLTIENQYRLNVEDERSSYLSQVINAVNKYVQKGDWNDYSSFDGESQELVSRLQQIPTAQRAAFVRDMPRLMRIAFASFDRNHRQDYDSGQFVRNMNFQIKKMSLSTPEDTDGAEFKRLRSLFYRFRVYNPQSGRMEEQNLARYITAADEVNITPEVQNIIIEPCRQIYRHRKIEYNKKVARGEINPELVEEAKILMRQNIKKARFLNNVDNLDISTLYEDTLPPHDNNPSLQPSDPYVPDDKAGWSDDLQRYWERFDGYQQLAKNNNEYTFKIKDSAVRYTAKNKVQMSDNAEYDMYVKLLNEPSNKNKPVRFKETLSKEQALKLYVACVNLGRKMNGAVPQDLRGLDNLRDIPAEAMQRFNQNLQNAGQNSPIQGQNCNFALRRQVNRDRSRA